LGIRTKRGKLVYDYHPPIFTQKRKYIERYLEIDEE
jgi:hypothetical protein